MNNRIVKMYALSGCVSLCLFLGGNSYATQYLTDVVRDYCVKYVNLRCYACVNDGKKLDWFQEIQACVLAPRYCLLVKDIVGFQAIRVSDLCVKGLKLDVDDDDGSVSCTEAARKSYHSHGRDETPALKKCYEDRFKALDSLREDSSK